MKREDKILIILFLLWLIVFIGLNLLLGSNCPNGCWGNKLF